MIKILLNPEGRNHIKFMASPEREMPEDEGEQIETVENIYNSLCEYGEIKYEKIKSGNYAIKVVKLGGTFYDVVSLRNEFGTYNSTIYEMTNENDAMAIAKFIGKNIQTLMKAYKQQVLDAKDMMVELPSEENTDVRES